MKAFFKSKAVRICLALVMCVIIGVCTVLASTAAEGDGVSFSPTEFYQMEKPLPSFTSYTFECEFYVPSNFTGRAYNFIGNWASNSADRDGNEWNIELHNNGSIRLYHAKGGDVYFNSNSSANTGTPTDYRIYTKDASGKPVYVKMTITVDTAAGNAYLYMNGEQVGSIINSTALKNRTYTASTKHPTHRIGFDYRDDTNCYFKGQIRNMAMYNYIRTDAEIKADAAAFAPSASDTGLMFAYDFTAMAAGGGFAADLSANGNNASVVNWTTTEGRSFTVDDELFATDTLSAMPRTYEAVIWAPLTSNRTGLLFGNYGSGNAALLNFEIYSSGKPSIYIKDESGNLMDTKFSYDIRRSGWAHLVITHETLESGGARFSCYVDGELVDQFTTELSYEFDPASLTTLSLGRDSRSGNVQYYKGRIKSLALYSDVLTQEQIKASYKNGIDADNESILCHYELNGTEGAPRIEDQSDNNVDLRPIFCESAGSPVLGEDYAYSFAVVGDTQKLVYYDAYNGTSYTSYIYDWLVANKDKKNIQFVMGMGDITDKNGKDQTADDGIDQTDIEWDIAVREITKLNAASIAYSLVQGNHDSVAQLDKFFASNANFTGADIGYYSGNSLGNYYMRFTAGGNKYMVFVFEYGPDDAVLTWAGNAIAANPDYSVILTTHAYMFRDGTTLDINDVVPPRTNTENTDPTSANYNNNGDQIWTKLASQYENVIMCLSGHDPCANVVFRSDLGIHGNTVFQGLVDFQSMDTAYDYKTGMVAMLYFSADGKQVKVEYISTYKTLEAQKLDPTAGDVLYSESINTMTLTYPEKQALASATVTINGVDGYVIPGQYANEVTYPFVVFKTDKTFIGGYGDLGAATAAAKAKGAGGNYVILMRRDAEQTTKSSGLASIYGSLTIDLGGNTLYKTAVGYIFDMYVDGNSGATLKNGYDTRGTFSMINGTIVSSDKSHPIACANYGASLAKSVLMTFVFDGITFVDVAGGYNILATWENGFTGVKGDTVMKVDVTFNDCVFDYKNSIDGTEMIYLINRDHYDYDRTVFNVQINGGKIISNSAISYATFIKTNDNTNGRRDTVSFGVGADGKYISQLLPIGTSYVDLPGTWTDPAGNKYHFTRCEETATNFVYDFVPGEPGEIIEPDNQTKYGWIPDAYLDAKQYPIVLFQNGEFVAAFSVYADGSNTGGAIAKAKELLDGNAEGEKGGEVFILFRGDATATSKFPNVGQILGTVNIDLNGYTLSQTYTNESLFFTQAKNWKGMDDATFNIYGGTVELKTNLLTFGAYGTGYADAAGMKTFHINFDNVTFKYAAGATAKQFLGRYSDDATTNGKSVGYDVKFNNCVFDLTNASDLTCLFNANDTKIGIEGDSATSGTNCIINIVVNGGEIISDNGSTVWAEWGENGSSVTFEKNENGSLTALTTAAESVTNGVVSSLGELVFVKSDAGNIFTLTPKALADTAFTPFVSITLDRDLILNVYVPVSDKLTALTFAGAAVDLTALETAELDGSAYYVIRTPLAASAAAGTLEMSATLTAGDFSATKSYTFSTVRYAELVLEGENEIEKALVKNVLSYVRAAYAYFSTTDEDAMARIDAILGKDYDKNNAHVQEGSAESVTTGFKGATLVLDATPAIRFYLEDGADASAYAFYIGGSKVNTVTGTDTNGRYIEIDVYAYAMCETVTYTTNGSEGGSYHIASYYAYAAAGTDASLTALVDRMWAYFQSARDYRKSVTG